jgi:hypothetical protein
MVCRAQFDKAGPQNNKINKDAMQQICNNLGVEWSGGDASHYITFHDVIHDLIDDQSDPVLQVIDCLFPRLSPSFYCAVDFTCSKQLGVL